MNAIVRSLSIAAALGALVACHGTPDLTAAPPPPNPAATATPGAPAPRPDLGRPVARANAADVDEDDVPLGPMFPPARVAPPTPVEARDWDDQISFWEKWFKDAFPAGESRTVRFHSAKDADVSHQIKRNQSPEPLQSALAVNTAFAAPILKILERRNNNDTTKFLGMYLTATNPKTAASAAEVVIENIFYGDRSAQAKCVEIGNDFEAIMQYGYFDQSVAGRREYLQARLDQVYTRAKQPRDLRDDAIVYVGVPLALAVVAGATGRALEHTLERAGALRASGVVTQGSGAVTRLAGGVGQRFESLLERTMARSARASEAVIEEVLKRAKMKTNVTLTGETARSLEKNLARKIADMPWRSTNESMLRYFVTEEFNGAPVKAGTQMIVFQLKDGARVRYATSAFMPKAEVEAAEKFFGTMTPATVQTVVAGRLQPSDLSISEVSGIPLNRPPPADQPVAAAARGPRAFRLGGDRAGNARVTEEAGVIVDAAAPVAAQASTAATTAASGARFNTSHALSVGIAGELAIMGVHTLGRVTGREDEMNINALYLGGEIGNSARPDPRLKPARRGE